MREKRKLAYLVWCVQAGGSEIMDALDNSHFEAAEEVLLSFIKHTSDVFDEIDDSEALDLKRSALLFLQNWEVDEDDNTRH